MEDKRLYYTDSELADAIYKAAGGDKAKVPYGILSVPVKDKQDAHRICLNTIRNNRVRFANQTKFTDYKELHKGSAVFIEGHLTQRTWKPDQGDKDVTVTEVQVGTIQFIDRAREEVSSDDKG